MTAVCGFVNTDYFCATPDLHLGKLFWEVKRCRRDRKEEGEEEFSLARSNNHNEKEAD